MERRGKLRRNILSCNNSKENVETAPNVLFSGWVYKYTNIVKRYRKRFFSISDDQKSLTYYYSSDPEQTKEYQGIIELENAEITKIGKRDLLITDGQTSFYLRTEKSLERHKWYKTLKELTKKRVTEINKQSTSSDNSDCYSGDLQSTISSLENSLITKMNEMMNQNKEMNEKWYNDLKDDLKKTNARVDELEKKLSDGKFL